MEDEKKIDQAAEDTVPETDKTAETPDIEPETPVEAAAADGAGEDDPKQSKKDKKAEKSELKKVTAELEAAKKAVDDAKKLASEATDKYLRVVAEYDNFRRRSAKEREGVYSEAYADAITQLLPLIDNLERAAAYTEPEKLAEGVKLILKTLPEALEKMGVEEIPAEKFDPNLHNAVMHADDPEKEEGAITDVFQKGYRRGDKIIRHAMVKVVN